MRRLQNINWLAATCGLALLVGVVIVLTWPDAHESSRVTEGADVRSGEEVPATARRTHGKKPDFQSAEAETVVREVGRYLGINVRMVGAPAREIPIPDLTQPTDKVIRKMAESLQVPVLGIPPESAAGQTNPSLDEEFLTLTVTPRGMIIGAPSEFLEEQLEKSADEDPVVRANALTDLGDLDDPRKEPLLSHLLLSDSDPEVRAEAAGALQYPELDGSLDALVSSLGDSEKWVRDNARLAIETVGQRRMEERLRAASRSEDAVLAYEAGDLLETVFGLEMPEDFWFELSDRLPKELQ